MFKKTLFTALSSLILAGLLVSTSINAGNNPGDQAIDFTLKNWDGATYTLSDFKNTKAIVIMFWSCECPYVQPYNDRISDFTNEYSKKGITFIAINSNSTETNQDVEAHAKQHNYPFPVLKDVNNVVADSFGATRTPEVFVLDVNRTILYHGRISDNREKDKETSFELKDALDDIIAGKDISVKETKSFGCSIKKVQKVQNN